MVWRQTHCGGRSGKDFEAKEPPGFDPSSFICCRIFLVEKLCGYFYQSAVILAPDKQFWPGPLPTAVLPNAIIVPDIYRWMDKPWRFGSALTVFSEIIRAFGGPLAAPAQIVSACPVSTMRTCPCELGGPNPLIDRDAGPTTLALITIVSIQDWAD